MKKNVILLLIFGIIVTVFCGCQNSATAGNEPESMDTTTQEVETDAPTIFDQLIVGEAINDLDSLYDLSEVLKIQDYYAVGACVHGENEFMVLYAGDDCSVSIVYDISTGKEKKRIEMEFALSLEATPVGVSEDFSYIRESDGRFIYLDWKSKKYEEVILDAVPASYLMLGEGESIYYTVENDCNVYIYIYGSERCYSVYDGSDVVDSLELEYLISSGTSIILTVESDNYAGYAELSLEMQELTAFDNLSGELIYCGSEYIYTTADKPNTILLYNPMTPRLSKEFRIENHKEIENLIFYKEDGIFLTKVWENDETIIRIYDLEAGILKNRIVIPKEYQVGKVECFQKSICVYVECRTENGEYMPLIWNTDIIEEILE